uniref:Uncharacterized protein n=1 Tax=Anopheles atroparvus TaxID=41427 RepID=A0AAG5D152_ANOAO
LCCYLLLASAIVKAKPEAPVNSYLPPEPAKYEFSYEVDDEDADLSFGHEEMRDGDYTTGKYNVLLPDGRRQIVEYEADHKGYRPKITYEGGDEHPHHHDQPHDHEHGCHELTDYRFGKKDLTYHLLAL